jgi:DNA-nicking Smr family endonuclease
MVTRLDATICGVSKKAKGFNTPFDELEALRAKLVPPPPPKPKAPAAAQSVKTAAPAAAPPPPPKTDEEALLEMMRGVAQLEPDPRGRIIGGTAPAPAVIRRPVDDEAEVYAELADLVDGGGPFDISATDEYVEALGPGIDRRLLRQLKAGDYALQAHLDLHGFNSEEARVEVDTFLTRARADGRRCVLIIHGRGHNSKDGVAVLKERLQVWLTRGRIGRGVLAFCTARPVDGGAGAVYVLLRK